MTQKAGKFAAEVMVGTNPGTDLQVKMHKKVICSHRRELLQTGNLEIALARETLNVSERRQREDFCDGFWQKACELRIRILFFILFYSVCIGSKIHFPLCSKHT